MQVVVLAAGTGSRLKNMTQSLPKALITVNGRPLLEYALAFALELRPEEIVVVTGAFGEKVEELLQGLKLPQVHWVRNPEFLRGNLYSLGAARPLLHGDFHLMNTDHIYRRAVAKRVRGQQLDLTAFCDTDRTLGADDMKVAAGPEGRLGQISKTLTRFDRGYVGMTYCPAEWRERYFQAFDRVAQQLGDKAYVEAVLADLAEHKQTAALGDISGFGWLEIDTPEERAAAEAVLRKTPQDFATLRDIPT